jgi:hypothetical protein
MGRLRTVGLGVGLGVGLLLWIAGPFAVLAVVMQADLSDELVVDEQPTVVVSESLGGAVTMMGVAMRWEAPVQLFAPAWEGVVQRVDVAPGAEVGNGDPVVTVSGLTRLLAASGEPFFRPLGLNASGDDARALNEWLTALGLPHGSGATVTSATVRGVREVASRVGVDVAAGAAVEFDPTWVVFAPRERFTVGSVDLRVGAPAPAPGAVFVTAQPALTAAVAVDAETAQRATEGSETPGAEGGTEPDDGGADGAAPQESPPDALPEGIPVPASRAVFVDEEAEVPLALAEDRMTFTPEALAALSQVVEPGERARRLVSRSVPVAGELQVPATAVAVGADGTFCVVDTSRRAYPVDVTDRGGGSISFLTDGGELSSGKRVLDRPPPSVACSR